MNRNSSRSKSKSSSRGRSDSESMNRKGSRSGQNGESEKVKFCDVNSLVSKRV